jgi:mannosyltransferase OCH1-like enzyme
VIKAALLQIFVLFLTISLGLAQDVSFDSLNQYYKNEFKELEKSNLDHESFVKKVENFSASEITEFSQFQASLELIALLDKNKKNELGVQLVSKIIPKTKAVEEFQAFLYYKLAQFYYRLDQPVQSLECYLKSSSFIQKLNNPSFLAHVYYRIGIINLTMP